MGYLTAAKAPMSPIRLIKAKVERVNTMAFSI